MSQIINLAEKIKVVRDKDNVLLYDKDSVSVFGIDGKLVITERSLAVPKTTLEALPFTMITQPRYDTLSELVEEIQNYLDNESSTAVTEIPLSIQLSTNGDGTGTINANGNYAVSPATFYYQPAAGEVIDLHSIQYYVQDDGAFPIDGYGAIAAGTITNGYDIEIVLGGVTYKINDGIKVTTNGDLFRLAAYTVYSEGTGAGAHCLLISDSKMQERFGRIILKGDNEDKVTITLNDNFSTLVKHHFRVTGHYL
jgi:hypothetical protein